MTVGILARPDLAEAGGALRGLLAWLHVRGVAACVAHRTAELAGLAGAGVDVLPDGEVAARADVLVVLGGDGTLLASSHLLQRREVPVLGVNFGSLGFLTEIALPELYPALQGVLEGRYAYEERRMLRAVVERGGAVVAQDDVLNDVVLTKTSLSRIIELGVWIDGAFVSAFRSDGLIVSSPTGSTAYNLAAGGPILHPLLSALVLTPICPHMLTNRPLVVSDQSSLSVGLHPHSDVAAQVTFDGQRGVGLQPADVVTVTRSPRTLRLVKAPGRDYFEVLRTKLKWGEPTIRRT